MLESFIRKATADSTCWGHLGPSVHGAPLRTFYDSVAASVIRRGAVCWSGSISAADKRRLNGLVEKVSSVLGCLLEPVEVVDDRRMIAMLSVLMENQSHPLPTEGYRRSFVRLKCTDKTFHLIFTWSKNWHKTTLSSTHIKSDISVTSHAKAVNEYQKR